jgi:hypothetical protein
MLQAALIGLSMFFWNKRQAMLGTAVAGTIESALAAGATDVLNPGFSLPPHPRYGESSGTRKSTVRGGV